MKEGAKDGREKKRNMKEATKEGRKEANNARLSGVGEGGLGHPEGSQLLPRVVEVLGRKGGRKEGR
jgi:hypothetical protein